jgi:hypothetical protein
VGPHAFRLIALNLDLSALHRTPASERPASAARKILNFHQRKVSGEVAYDNDDFPSALRPFPTQNDAWLLFCN